MHILQRALILSASYGDGHRQASNAIYDAFAFASPETEVKIIDFMRMTHPMLDSITKYCYLKSIRYMPRLWEHFYKRTSALQPTSTVQKRLNRLGIEKLLTYIETYKPDVVIATFPTPAGVMSVLKEQNITKIPLATVITDFAIHSQWIHPHTDLYFVGSDAIKQGLIKRGISEQKIAVTGIPVRRAFMQAYDKTAARQNLQLEPHLPTLLIMGGAYGVIGDLVQICEELFTTPRGIQVVVICGRNTKLRQQMQELKKQAVIPVHIYGFVKHIPIHMAAADLILTKAGGLTVSESLAMELPMLLYRPIPGQEQQNATFLVQSEVAVLASSRQQVFHYINTLLSPRCMQLQQMKQNTKIMKRTHAAIDIVNHVSVLPNELVMRNVPAFYSSHFEG